jgi:hypothetical protein
MKDLAKDLLRIRRWILSANGDTDLLPPFAITMTEAKALTNHYNGLFLSRPLPIVVGIRFKFFGFQIVVIEDAEFDVWAKTNNDLIQTLDRTDLARLAFDAGIKAQSSEISHWSNY